MKIKSLIMLLLIGVLAQNIFSQAGEITDSAKSLAEKIKTDGNQAILDAGKSGDKTLIPYLKTLTGNHFPWAQRALAKLGDKDSLNQILAEVDDANPGVQDSALNKLAYVGNKESFRKFYELLDDTTPRESPVNDVMFFDRSTTAIYILCESIVEIK